VATVQPQDAYSDCSMINAEIQANNNRAQALASEQNAKVVQNVAAGVVGIVVWPVWFAMPKGPPAQTPQRSRRARNISSTWRASGALRGNARHPHRPGKRRARSLRYRVFAVRRPILLDNR
jgi:hypothetical protein